MTNTAENLILDRFSDEELMKAEPTALLALAKELRAAGRERPRPRHSRSHHRLPAQSGQASPRR